MITEKQIHDFWNERALDYRLGKISELELIKQAMDYAYNLALEDVRKELEDYYCPEHGAFA